MRNRGSGFGEQISILVRKEDGMRHDRFVAQQTFFRAERMCRFCASVHGHSCAPNHFRRSGIGCMYRIFSPTRQDPSTSLSVQLGTIRECYKEHEHSENNEHDLQNLHSKIETSILFFIVAIRAYPKFLHDYLL